MISSMNCFESLDSLKTELEHSLKYNGIVLLDEPIAPKTTFKIGGNAPLYCEPKDFNSLIFLIATLKEKNIPHFILGLGSNVVVSDKGFDGAVICTSRLSAIETIPVPIIESAEPATLLSSDANAKRLSKESQESKGTQYEKNIPHPIDVSCESGTSIASFVNFCKKNAIANAEEFAGLPGSVGGAVYMNARCFDKSISDILKSVFFLNMQTLKTETYLFSASDWDYKKSPFQKKDAVILRATFSLVKHDAQKERIAEKCRTYIQQRVEKGHFEFPSAGSVFKNNRDFKSPSGKLIDECGLCGLKIGGAQIAPWHGNFIINTGNACAKDVRALVELIANEVKKQKGFELSPEIIFCGKEV